MMKNKAPAIVKQIKKKKTLTRKRFDTSLNLILDNKGYEIDDMLI